MHVKHFRDWRCSHQNFTPTVCSKQYPLTLVGKDSLCCKQRWRKGAEVRLQLGVVMPGANGDRSRTTESTHTGDPFFFYCYSITVVCLFSPSLHPTPAKPPSLPQHHPPPCVHGSFIVVPENPSPHSSLPLPLWLLLDCSYFNVSGYIYIFLLFSFVDYVPVKDDII